MFGIGYTELVVILFMGLLLFGNRLPEIAKSLGQSVLEFKKGISAGDQSVGT